MIFWWTSNIYWLIMVIWGSFKLNAYPFDTSELGEDLSRALIVIVVIAAVMMISQLQAAWYCWLKNRHPKN